ncbi:nucleotidyltransferase domain-containing protein [Candidatus Poribacteria bacterium]|nr:nucleotidyltransferase domain-containing protein [Candidatus Poribacteria bacterium]
MSNHSEYIEAFLEIINEREKHNNKLREYAKQTANSCAQRLVKDFGAKKVYLFGSLIDNTFTEGSDIDLAIEGAEVIDYLKAIAMLEGINGFSVDLLDIESCPAPIKKRILKYGKVLFDETIS